MLDRMVQTKHCQCAAISPDRLKIRTFIISTFISDDTVLFQENFQEDDIVCLHCIKCGLLYIVHCPISDTYTTRKGNKVSPPIG